ncbi:MAG: M48 family metalloprotease [Proteobacteria bacterium]|nr:M48 family metalloprotease [Pseudomonadota bacterium]
MTFTRENVDSAWQEALRVWGINIRLSPPQNIAKRQKWHGGDEPLAYIDLKTRQIAVNFRQLSNMGAEDSLCAVLAHEIGHHVSQPHTLGVVAQLEVLQRRLLHGKQSLTNLFFDLLVNEEVGRTMSEQILQVYRGSVEQNNGHLTPMFAFYLAIYEELWDASTTVVPPAVELNMDERFPGWRSEANLFVQTFYTLPELTLQFVYFCSRFSRYLHDDSGQTGGFPLAHDIPAPDVGDYANAVRGTQRTERALAEAAERGWIAKGKGGHSKDPFQVLNDLISGGSPGTEAAPFRRAVASNLYRVFVDRHLIELPRVGETEPEPFIPTTTTDWEYGDDPRSIDWTQSILSSGILAGIRPLRRELEPDDSSFDDGGVPAMEIYLDTSGSMPRPDYRTNAMTLAAQILSAATLRKSGRVRAVVYSSGEPMVSEWMYDESKAREFLLHFSGGGTDFPFDQLVDWVDDTPQAMRVILSDADFYWNLDNSEKANEKLKYAIDKSIRVVAMLNVSPDSVRDVADRFPSSQFEILAVPGLNQFGPMAAALARALVGDP